jgi:predicted metallo-beta-lactamase superfamily hydrolase
MMQKIDPRFSFDGLDLPAMQQGVEDSIEFIESIVKDAMKQGVLDEGLLRSAHYGLAHSSARAQEECALVRDASLPNLWTVAALK